MPWSGSCLFPHLHHFNFPLCLPFFPFLTFHSFHSSHMPTLIDLRPLTCCTTFLLFLKIFIWLGRILAAVCGILWSLLWHAGSLFIYLVVAWKLLVVACWDLVPWPQIEPLPLCIGSTESCPLDHQGSTLFLECLLSTLSWLSPSYPSWPWFHYYFLRKAF